MMACARMGSRRTTLESNPSHVRRPVFRKAVPSMRFHFDLTDGRITMPDPEGADAADLAEAIEQAAIVIEELRGTGELQDVDSPWDLVIKDSRGQELHRLQILPSE